MPIQRVNAKLVNLDQFANIWREKVFGAEDSQTDFELPEDYPVGKSMLEVYVNGAFQRVNIDYAELTSRKIRFTEPLIAEDVVHCKWQLPKTALSTATVEVKLEEAKKLLNVIREQHFTVREGETVFLLNSTFTIGTNSLDVYLNGIKQRPMIDFVEVNNNTIRFFQALRKNDKLHVKWYGESTSILLGTVDIRDVPDQSIPDSKISGLRYELDTLGANIEKVSIPTKNIIKVTTNSVLLDARSPGLLVCDSTNDSIDIKLPIDAQRGQVFELIDLGTGSNTIQFSCNEPYRISGISSMVKNQKYELIYDTKVSSTHTWLLV
ncbi:virion structural protein [Bacillus phage vB_BceM-HSE3]|nr:virion structural protein [Bacillus phage vB_BceM-HSE3]